MAVIKARGAAKKLGPLTLGRNIACLTVRKTRRVFSVHEDLLCANSAFFKNRLQKDRKTVEGECSICHEDLEPNTNDLVFCKAGCGQNIHEHCMVEWKASQHGSPTCPMCRRNWHVEPPRGITVLDNSLDQSAIQLYIDWLYTRQIRIPDTVLEDEDETCITLLKSWTVAVAIKDEEFKHAVVAELATLANYLLFNSVFYAFEESEDVEMQQFVIDKFLKTIKPNFFKDHADDFPDEFVHGLGDALLQERVDGPLTQAEILKKYTQGKYEFVEE